MESNTNAEIQGAKAASRNLSSKLYKLDQESLKQQEIVYNQVGGFNIIFRAVNLLTTNVPHLIETSQLICNANQLICLANQLTDWFLYDVEHR